MVISFLGPDGSGKSTIIEEVKNNMMFEKYHYFHLKPIKKSNKESESSIVDDPHMHPVYSKFKSYIKLLVFIYQYNFGWYKNIKHLNTNTSLVIFDRYYDDLLVDFKRYRYGGNRRIAKFVLKFIPKLDAYFILTTDSDIIYKRKQEVSIKELNRQIKAYKSLVNIDEDRYFCIDVNRKPSEITEDINQILRKKVK